MYNIIPVCPYKWRENSEMLEFYDNLAKKPYCSSGKDDEGNLFSCILSKNNAIRQPLIQPNAPHEVKYIIIDMDDDDALHTTLKEYSDVPPPHFIMKSNENGRAHLAYRLANPVYVWGKARSHPVRYLAKIEKGLKSALGGDAGYNGNLMKNPIHAKWRTYSVTTAPKNGYTLNELEEALIEIVNFTEVHNSIKIAKPANEGGFGRNNNLFDRVRYEAYKLGGGRQTDLMNKIHPIAKQMNNDFEEPLLPNEVKHLAKSIARYCSKKDFSKSDKEFSARQSSRSKKRWGDSTEKQKIAAEMYANGVKKTLIAKELNVTPRTLTNWGLRKKKK